MMFGMVWMVLIWAVLIGLAVWLVQALFPRPGVTGRQMAREGGDANQILDRRYARGEISREEYDLMKETLAQSREWR